MNTEPVKISPLAAILGLIAAERAVESLKTELVHLSHRANKDDSIDLWCAKEFYEDPNINMARWAKGISKEAFDAYNQDVFKAHNPILDSEWAAIRGEVKFVRMKKRLWANYLLSYILPKSRAYRSIRARYVKNIKS